MPPGSRPVLHRLRDVEEVSAHRALGLVRAPGNDGLHDGGVLRHGRGGASGNQDRAVLVAHGLRVQGVDEAAARCRAARARAAPRAGPRSRPTRRGGRRSSSRSRWRARHACRRARAGIVDPLGGLADGQPFQDGAGLQDLDRLLVRDLPHARAAVRLADDEPFLLEPDERRSHGAARHLEGRAEIGLDEARVGREVAAHDGVAERVVAGVRRHGGHDTAQRCEDRQQFCL